MSGGAPVSSVSECSATQSSDSSNGSFAFYIHSQDTLNYGVPLHEDRKAFARQKRRRTSPEDHAILEAEYQLNPKPDKAARMQIVERVALGEKEVQIWFQNRRQNTRRKSRPLLTQDIIDIPQMRHPSTEEQDGTSFVSDNNHARLRHTEDTPSPPVETTASNVLGMDRREVQSASHLQETGAPFDPSAQEVNSSFSSQTSFASSGTQGSADPFTESSYHEGHREVAAHNITGFDLKTFSSSFGGPGPAQLGYISNRRSAPSAVHASVIEPLSQPSSGSYHQPIDPRCFDNDSTQKSHVLKRTSSLVRLSMTLDGKAKVTTNEEGSPSPPRVQPLALAAKFGQRSTLQRSTSLVASGPESEQSGNTDILPWSRRTTSGRSRDARTWEFYCDSDARNALTTQAEQEQSGSAVGAIALIKARQKKALAPNANKRNVQSSRAAPVKRIKSSSGTEKPKLSRALSSMARLETVHGNEEDQPSKIKKKSLDDGLQPTSSRSPSGDSDKENWEPGTEVANVRRRRVPEAENNCQRPVLKENLHVISQSSSLGAVLNRENITPRRRGRTSAATREKDTEVVAFMGESSVRREEEDLDCVQNLLSLSQGAWR